MKDQATIFAFVEGVADRWPETEHALILFSHVINSILHNLRLFFFIQLV